MVETHSCLWFIKSLDFFPQLSEAEMQELAARSEMFDVAKGEAFSVRNAETGHVYLLKRGRMRSLRQVADGRKVALDILSPGDVVGATAIVSGGADSESFEALEPCLVCRIRGQVLESLLEQNGQVGLSVMHRVGLRKRKIESRLLDMVFCTVPMRVARLLTDFGEQFGKSSPSGVVIDLKLTHQELADLIGANREATTRALGLLLDVGAIGYQGKLIVIRDAAALAAAANRVSRC